MASAAPQDFKRVKLTQQQIDSLQAAFLENEMLDAARRQMLADELGLAARQIHVWFQNRRQRSREQRESKPSLQGLVPALRSEVAQPLSRSSTESVHTPNHVDRPLLRQAGPLTPQLVQAQRPTEVPPHSQHMVQTGSQPADQHDVPNPNGKLQTSVQKPRWHHTLLKTDRDLKISTPVPCVFDQAPIVVDGSILLPSKKREAPNDSGSSEETELADGEDEKSGKPGKRARILKRTKLTEEQMSILSAAFVSNSMPDTFKRHLLAAHLGLTPRCVHVWFQNRRQRLKVTEPRQLSADGQFEWRNLLASRATLDGTKVDGEPHIEAEPALRALAAMHTKSRHIRPPPQEEPPESLMNDGSESRSGGGLDLLLAAAE